MTTKQPLTGIFSMSELSGKQLVGKEIAQYAKNNQVIGIGTGSTVDAAIDALAERIKLEKLNLSFVPTSYQTTWRCEKFGFQVKSQNFSGDIDWGFDGADAVDTKGHAIKGKGGALLEEKVLAKKCLKYFIIVDDSKVVSDICIHCAVPVEVIPSARKLVEAELNVLGAKSCTLRDGLPGKHGPVITEHGNIILDVQFPTFFDGLEGKIKSIVGVVESGLFERYANAVLVARKNAIETLPIR